MPKSLERCSGYRAADVNVVEDPNKPGSFLVWLPLYTPDLGDYGSDLYAEVLAPNLTSKAIINWAGPLGCFPAVTEKNRIVKEAMVAQHGADAFFAAVTHQNSSFLAPVALPINGDETPTGPYFVHPCEGCPKFDGYRK